jgi:hypothetical protein
MGGGLLNLIANGPSNILLFGNPKISMFKSTYKSITNFGIQRIRLDTLHTNKLSYEEETLHTFVVRRHGDLFGECFLVFNLPDVYSRLYSNDKGIYRESAFKWIREIGTNIINEVEITAGGQILGKYTGEYFSIVTNRDKKNKISLWNEMTGNLPELYDPANANGRLNTYPNVSPESQDPEPSIRGRKIYVPLEMWFTKDAATAIPLVALQYSEVRINIRIKPIKELFTVRDIYDTTNSHPHLPFQNIIRPVPEPTDLPVMQVSDFFTMNEDIHMIGTYFFLTDKERKTLASKDQQLLITDVYQHIYNNIYGASTVRISSRGLVECLTMRFRRNDAYLRNEWSNYTNWPYYRLPYDIIEFTENKQFCVTHGTRQAQNMKYIMQDMSILMDGKTREDKLDGGVYAFCEPYSKTVFDSKEGLYMYSFSLMANASELQPQGAMNLDKFERVELEMNIITPPLRDTANTQQHKICQNGEVIGVRKYADDLYQYLFDLCVYEEKYNVVYIKSGIIGLLFAR